LSSSPKGNGELTFESLLQPSSIGAQRTHDHTAPLHHLRPNPAPDLGQDEVLAHRLGLVPLNVDPGLLEWKGPEDAASEANTVVLRLKVACERDESGAMVHESGGCRAPGSAGWGSWGGG
jgi:hypothetical protein